MLKLPPCEKFVLDRLSERFLEPLTQDEFHVGLATSASPRAPQEGPHTSLQPVKKEAELVLLNVPGAVGVQGKKKDIYLFRKDLTPEDILEMPPSRVVLWDIELVKVFRPHAAHGRVRTSLPRPPAQLLSAKSVPLFVGVYRLGERVT